MNEMDEIVHEFLVESHENLDQLDQDLVALEQEPDSRPLLGSVFRTIHTIKGTSGFLAFGQLEKLTHVGEGLLSHLRDGRMVAHPRDHQRAARAGRRRAHHPAQRRGDGTEGDVNIGRLMAKLAALQNGEALAARRARRPPTSTPTGRRCSVRRWSSRASSARRTSPSPSWSSPSVTSDCSARSSSSTAPSLPKTCRRCSAWVPTAADRSRTAASASTSTCSTT